RKTEECKTEERPGGLCTGKRRDVTVAWGNSDLLFGGSHARVPDGQRWIASLISLIAIITLRSTQVVAPRVHRRCGGRPPSAAGQRAALPRPPPGRGITAPPPAHPPPIPHQKE